MAIVLRSARRRSQKLQVIDHDQFDVFLRLEPARLGPQFQDAQARAVIDVDLRLGELRCRSRETWEIAFRQKAIPHFLQVHPGAGTKETLHELLAAHFQAEHRDGQLLVDRHVLGDIHSQRRLSHAGPRRDHDHLGFVQPVGHPIQLGKPRRDSSDAAAPLVELLDRFDRFHDLVLHGEDLAFETVFADRKNFLFYFVEQVVHFVLFFERAPDALGAGCDDLTKDVFVADDFEVVGDVRRRRDKREQTRHGRRPADSFK